MSLSSFASVDLRSINKGDIVIFRSNSLGHRANLVLNHGRPARVVGFARNRTGAQQVTIQFKDSEPISLAASNLIARTPESLEAARAAHTSVQAEVSAAREDHGPQVAEAIAVRNVQLTLLAEGCFDSLDAPAEPVNDDEDFPF